MITIKSKNAKAEDGTESVTPSDVIPVGYKVRFIDGLFQAIPQNEEWQDECPPS